MEDKKELTPDELMDSLMARFEERQTMKDREEELSDQAAKAAKYDEMVAGQEKEETWAEEKKSVHIKKESELGFANEDMVMFDKYLRGEVNERTAAKALQEGSATEGGVLVPNDWHKQLIELRDQASFPRKMGVQQITTTMDNIDIPAEATSYTKFDFTGEEAAYTSNDPALAQNNVTLQKWTKMTKVAEELAHDNAYDLDGFLVRALGRAMAQTENYYVAVGSGSSQHLGIMEGGDTDALTFDSSGNITPDEIIELFYTLGAGYRENAAWLMNSSTWRYVIGMRDANNWAWLAADQATIPYGSGQPDGLLLGKPVFLQDDIEAIGASTCVIMVGDPYYYALVDREGLVIQRLDELFAANGQIGYKAYFRQSGTVLYETAFVGGAMSA